MKIFSFLELYQFAKEHSPFYRELYNQVSDSPKIEDLPIVESTSFWAVNGPFKNQVLTSKHDDGIVFKSGGTSGNAKFSYFSKDEWKTFTDIFGEGMSRGAIQNGEKVANFFYAGDLYASFIFIMKSIEAAQCKVLQLPLSGTSDLDSISKIITEFGVDVWAGPPTTLMKIAEVAARKKAHIPRKILFGGESFYPDQRSHLLSLFPGVEIRSIGYASVDGGLMGFADLNCEPQEHRVFSKYTIIEIIDPETEKPITEAGRPGKILLTNLCRKLMPIIRYPVGDLGEWVDAPSVHFERKFKILGRSDEGARIGPTTLYYDDVAAFLHDHQSEIRSAGFQLVIKHFNQLDQLLIRVAKTSQDKISTEDLVKLIEKERPVLFDLFRDKKIHRIAIEFVNPEELQTNSRTGKLKRIIDERF